MSNAQKLFSGLQGAFTSARRVGTTTVLGIAAPKHGLLIIAGTTDSAKQIQESEQLAPRHVASLLDAEQGKLDGRGQPLVLDNYAVIKLCDVALNQFDKDAADIARINREWHKQNLEYDRKLQKLGSEHVELQYATGQQQRAHKLQIDAYERELLGLKIRLAVKQVRHIRVTRKRRR